MLIMHTNKIGSPNVYWGMNGLPMVTGLPVSVQESRADRVSALFDTHHDRLYRLARRLAPDIEDALDLVQETFLRAARHPWAVPCGETAEEAWLVRVLVNIRRDQWRRAAVRKRHDIAPDQRSGVDHGQEAAFIARATVWRALDVLNPRRRTIVIMHELEGLTIQTIARRLGISAVTVRWHLSMGRRELSRVLIPAPGEFNEQP
jgi:RNA polymerase sigma-70 factor (ECF subfamily)